MSCEFEYVVIHLFRIPLGWNVILGFGTQFSDGRHHSGKDSQRNIWNTLGRVTSTTHTTTYHRISKKIKCKLIWKSLEYYSCRWLFGWQIYLYSLSYWLWCNILQQQTVPFCCFTRASGCIILVNYCLYGGVSGKKRSRHVIGPRLVQFHWRKKNKYSRT